MTTAGLRREKSDNTISTTSSVPVLGEGFQEKTAAPGNEPASNPKTIKKPLPLFGRNREATSSDMATAPSSQPTAGGLRSSSPFGMARASSPKPAPASPGRVGQSPRVASPASSQIFERSVQEEVAAATSPAIPSHIATENHIPPVLESASKAITDDRLDPDAVEIITHLAHQPAAQAVAGGSTTDLPLTPIHSVQSTSSPEFAALHESSTAPIVVPVPLSSSMLGRASPLIGGDSAALSPGSDDGSSTFGGGAPNYGSLDSNDVRRLSFISFADVVHAENLGGDNAGMRDSLLVSPNPAVAGSPVASSAALARSPSPMRSPVSPSLSAASGAADTEGSPSRAGLGLGVGGSMHASMQQGASPPNGGELSIETMGQALRNTTSRDLRSSLTLGEEESERR